MTTNIPTTADYTRQAADISAHSQIVQLISQDPRRWYQKRNLRLLYLILIPACLASEITSGIDSSMLTGLQAVKEWNDYFSQPSGAILGLMTAAYGLGSFISLPVVAIVIDRFGRKFAIVAACLWIAAGSVIQACSINIGMFVAARVIMGFGLPTLLTASASLLNELCYPKERAVIASLLSVFYYPGAIIGSGITLSTFARPDTWSWRIPSICQIIPCILQLVFIWFVPESPRWLVFKNRTDEAYDILAKYHAEGDRDHPLVKAEYEEIVKNIELEMNNSRRSWGELFTTRANRWRSALALMVGCYSQFSGYAIPPSGISTVLTVMEVIT
jgi:MFS family permease